MELELSRGTVYAFTVVLLAGVLTLFGSTVTPVDGDGEPLVLSPAYVATMRYLRTTQGWLEELQKTLHCHYHQKDRLSQKRKKPGATRPGTGSAFL